MFKTLLDFASIYTYIYIDTHTHVQWIEHLIALIVRYSLVDNYTLLGKYLLLDEYILLNKYGLDVDFRLCLRPARTWTSLYMYILDIHTHTYILVCWSSIHGQANAKIMTKLVHIYTISYMYINIA